MGGCAGANEEQVKQLKGKEARGYAQRRSQWLLQRGHGKCALQNLTGQGGTAGPPVGRALLPFTQGRLEGVSKSPCSVKLAARCDLPLGNREARKSAGDAAPRPSTTQRGTRAVNLDGGRAARRLRCLRCLCRPRRQRPGSESDAADASEVGESWKVALRELQGDAHGRVRDHSGGREGLAADERL